MSETPALAVRCPACQAPPRALCVTASKKQCAPSYAHALRLDAWKAVNTWLEDNGVTKQTLHDYSNLQDIIFKQKNRIAALTTEISSLRADLQAAQEAAEKKLEIEGYVAILNPADVRVGDEVLGVDNTNFIDAKKVIDRRDNAFRITHVTDTEFWVYFDQHRAVRIRRFDAA